MGGSLCRRSILGLAAIAALAVSGGQGARGGDPEPATDAPLSPEETARVTELERALGSPDLAARERAAELLSEGPGARAAALLLELATHDQDPEVRFRGRALVRSLLMRHFLATPCGPGWLGVFFTATATSHHEVAIVCDTVEKDGPAFRAGFKDGEVVVLVDGKPFRDGNELRDMIHGIAPGTTAAITVEREGVDVVVPVVIGHLRDDKGNPLPPERNRQRDLARWRFKVWLAAQASQGDVAAANSAAR